MFHVIQLAAAIGAALILWWANKPGGNKPQRTEATHYKYARIKRRQYT